MSFSAPARESPLREFFKYSKAWGEEGSFKASASIFGSGSRFDIFNPNVIDIALFKHRFRGRGGLRRNRSIRKSHGGRLRYYLVLSFQNRFKYRDGIGFFVFFMFEENIHRFNLRSSQGTQVPIQLTII